VFGKFQPGLVLATIIVLWALPAQAQYPPTQPGQPTPSFSDEVTVTATGVETTVEEAPTAVTVVTRDEIDDAQSGSVAEMLRRVPGLTVVGSGDQGKLTSVFTRGTGSNQTLVMLDGVRLNSPFFGGFDWSRLSTGGLSRVEVARGPYSALWGADAVGGVINLIPARSQSGFNGRVFGEGGSEGWRRLEADIGWGGKAFDLYASGFDEKSDGELENADFENRQLLLTAGWSWGQRGSRLGIVVQNLEAETGIPFATPDSLTPNRRQDSDQTLVAVPFNLFFSDSWNIELTWATIDGTFNFSDPDDPFFSYSGTETTSSQIRLASNHRFSRHVFSWGGEWRKDEVDSASNLGVNLEGETNEITSAFLQDVWQIASTVRLLVGVRWDDHDDWGSEVSPRADLGWRLSDTFELRGGYGKAFRPPSIGELYFPLSGNPDLEPETSSSTDLGLVYTTRSKKSQWQVTTFSTDPTSARQRFAAPSSAGSTPSASVRRRSFRGPTSRLRTTRVSRCCGDPNGAAPGPSMERSPSISLGISRWSTWGRGRMSTRSHSNAPRPTVTQPAASPSPTACGTVSRSLREFSTSPTRTTRRHWATRRPGVATSSVSASGSTRPKGGRALLNSF